MDNSVFEKILENSNETTINTEQCLTNYYKEKGYNVFTSAEFAQNNISNFIEFVNSYIKNSNELNIPYIFSSATKNVVNINNDYYFIKKIKEKLEVLDWKKFEILSAQILEQCFGAFDTKTTQFSADGGLDFEGKIPIKSTFKNMSYGFIEVYGQSKRYAGNVGIYDIKSFVAFANSKKRNYVHPPQLFMFFTSSDFGKNSKKELNENGFIGLNGLQLSTLIYNHKIQLSQKCDFITELID
jgi:hypothetical protein